MPASIVEQDLMVGVDIVDIDSENVLISIIVYIAKGEETGLDISRPESSEKSVNVPLP